PAASGGEDGLKEKPEPLARSAPTPEVYKEGLVRGWESASDAVLEDGVLSQDEEHRLMQLAADLTLAQPELDRRRTWTTEYFEQRVQRAYAGVSQGLSIRSSRASTIGLRPSA